MNDLFGKTLRALMDGAEVKEWALAEALSYDTTYISKWLNGSKLPSPRNAESVIRQIAGFLVRQQGGDESREQELFHTLKAAYDRDSSYISFQAYNNHKTSFLRGRQEVIELLNDALLQMPRADGRDIVITASFDLLRLYRENVTVLIRTLRSAGAQRIRLTAVIPPEALHSDERFYTDSLLAIIGGLDYIEISLLAGESGLPEILTIHDVFCMQILWNIGGEIAAVFSSDREVVAEFTRVQGRCLSGLESLLAPARPEELRRTNVQLDSYADKRQWLFFNEPPALLSPTRSWSSSSPTPGRRSTPPICGSSRASSPAARPNPAWIWYCTPPSSTTIWRRARSAWATWSIACPRRRRRPISST